MGCHESQVRFYERAESAQGESRATRTMLAPSSANGLIALWRSSRDTPRQFVLGKRPATGASQSSPRTRLPGSAAERQPTFQVADDPPGAPIFRYKHDESSSPQCARALRHRDTRSQTVLAVLLELPSPNSLSGGRSVREGRQSHCGPVGSRSRNELIVPEREAAFEVGLERNRSAAADVP